MNKSLLLLLILICASGFNINAGIFPHLEDACYDLNRPLLLFFFELSCFPCYDSFLEMQFFIKKNRIDVQLIGVADESYDQLNYFKEKYHCLTPLVNDTDRLLFRRYKVRELPWGVILKDGQELFGQSYFSCSGEEPDYQGSLLKKWLLENQAGN